MGERLQSVIEEMRGSGILYAEGVREFKKRFIGYVLAKNGNQSRAARELGMHRNSLHRNMEELGIEKKPVRGYFLSEKSKAAIG